MLETPTPEAVFGFGGISTRDAGLWLRLRPWAIGSDRLGD
jgi:hypothetical protein